MSGIDTVNIASGSLVQHTEEFECDFIGKRELFITGFETNQC